MDASDKAASSESTEPKAKGGRWGNRKPKAADPETPQSLQRRKEAEEFRARGKKNPVTETFYELVKGTKLVLCKRKASGSVYRVFIGQVTQSESKNAEVRAFNEALKAKIKKLEAAGKLKIRL